MALDTAKAIEGHMAFFPHKMDACLVDGDVARRDSPRIFGFATSQIIGPFKGEPGSENM